MAFNLFPYSNFHKLNMDWVLQKIKDALHLAQEAQEAAQEASDAVAGYDDRLNTITGDITALDGRMDTAEDDIDALEGRVVSAENSLSAKADKTRPIVFDWLTIAQQNNQNGVNLRLIGGNPYAVGVHPVSSGNVDTSIYACVGVGNPTENGHAAPKKYVDDADALKVDISAPVMNNPVKVIDPSTNNGVGIFVVGGPVWGAALHPVINGTINSSVDAPLSVGAPTSNNHAATKQYVDDHVVGYTEVTLSGSAPAFAAQENTIYTGGVLSSLTVSNAPATGIWGIVFTSGSTATVVSGLSGVLGLETFQPAANTIYEINVLDNRAVVGAWEVSA